MSNNYNVLLLLLCLLALSQCTKDEYVIDDDILVEGLTPSFALPLAHADISLAQLEGPLGLDDQVYSQAGSNLAVVFQERLFEIGLEDLVTLPPQEASESFEADALTAAVFNASLEGDQIELGQTYNTPFAFDNGEELDSIRLGTSSLSIAFNSTFRHDLNVTVTIPELSNADGVFMTSFDLDYQGTVPVVSELEVDVSGYLLDFTGPGNNNALNIVADFIITHSGEMTQAGDNVSFEFELSSNSIQAGYGYLGQYAGIAEIDTQQVDIFQSIDAQYIYFADPRIELDFYNSSGIPMEIDFTSLFAPDNQQTQLITGGALEDIPTIAAASSPGTIALTEHSIDNSNTNPQLSDMLSEGPVELIYTAEGTTNPIGFTDNFILDTSVIACDATVILPLHASVQGYRFSDTLDVDLTVDLGLNEGSAIGIDDVEQVQFRIVSDNGLPLDLALQVLFLDENYEVKDSLYTGADEAVVLAAGVINTTAPIGDPDRGRVIAASHHVADTYMSPQRLEAILDQEIEHVIVRVLGNTSEAADGELVRFYPEDGLEVQLSAKIETDIDFNE